MSSGIRIYFSGRALNRTLPGCLKEIKTLNPSLRIKAGLCIVAVSTWLKNYSMNRFSQFNIKASTKGFEGGKIKMARILNREIVVHDFKIEESKVPAFREKGSGRCLHLQISIDNEMHVVFTSGTGLIETIQLVPKDQFPFTSIIIEENDRYKFT
jgi:hypothetical protein